MNNKCMIFSLPNNNKYMVLDATSYKGKDYLYTVQVDDTLIKSLGKYSFFEKQNNMVSEIDDEVLSDELYELFTEKYLQKYGE